MRWYKPIPGETKIKRKFALFPITIERETRWLEWVVIQYHYGYLYDEWFVDKFVD